MYRRQVCNVCRRNILFSEMGRAKDIEREKGEARICVFAKFFGEMIKGWKERRRLCSVQGYSLDVDDVVERWLWL